MGLPGVAAGRADSGSRAEGFLRIRSDPAVPGAREGGQSAFDARATPRRADRDDLPAARRHPAGDRVGGCPRLRTRGRVACRPPRRSLPSADRRETNGTTAAPDPAGDARLELRTADRT